MEETNVISAADNDTLEYTQSIRRKLASDLIKNEKIHEDPEASATLLKTLDGLDKVALGRSKIKASIKASESNITSATAIIELLKQVNPHTGKITGDSDLAPKELPSDMRLTDAVPGELEINPDPITYATFTAQTA